MLHSLFFVERIFRTIKTVTTHRSVSPLLSTVLPRPAPQLSVPGAALYVDAVDDVEELLHHGHLLEDELDLAVEGLRSLNNGLRELDRTDGLTIENIYFSGRFISLRKCGIIALFVSILRTG